MAKLRIAMTGATGLLGRNLLFEIIKQNLNNLDQLEVFVLGRRGEGKELRQRIWDILNEDGGEYISADVKIRNMILEQMDDFLKCVPVDLEQPDLGLSEIDFKKMADEPFRFFYHIGASTDLRSGASREKYLMNVNVGGTRRILDLVTTLQVEEFDYVGTAYACGNVSGLVMPDYINFESGFRNPYEKTKMEAEVLVRQVCKRAKIKCKIFRPSVTCGRLIEKPLGAVSKFDVIYGWTGFFWAIKNREGIITAKQRGRDLELSIRIAVNKSAGLNIVSADYVAKMMYYICMYDVKGEAFYLVSYKASPHTFYIPLLLSAANFSEYSFVDLIPKNLNFWENLYYKTVGDVFTPYLLSDEICFCTDNLPKNFVSEEIRPPEINIENMGYLMEYAKKYDFGMNKR